MAEVCAVACILCVVFMAWAAIKRTDPKRIEQLEILHKKYRDTRAKLIPILIEQTLILNSQIRLSEINEELYFKELITVAQRFDSCGFSRMLKILPAIERRNIKEILFKEYIKMKQEPERKLTIEELESYIDLVLNK